MVLFETREMSKEYYKKIGICGKHKGENTNGT